MSFLGQYWRGEKPLWKAFWLWGFVIPLVIQMVIVVSSGFILGLLGIDTGETGFAILGVVYGILATVYAVWILVSIWRCAVNSSTVWMVIARIIVIMNGLGVVFGIGGMILAFVMVLSMDPDTNNSDISVYSDSVPLNEEMLPSDVQEQAPQPLPATGVEGRVKEMMDYYRETKQVVSDQDKRYFIEHWNEAMTLLTRALLSEDQEQGMGAAYIFLDMGESFIPMFEEKMKDQSLPIPVRVRVQWVLINMRTPNDKTLYKSYTVQQ